LTPTIGCQTKTRERIAMKLGSLVRAAELRIPAKFGRDPISGYRVAMD
jgi:hypothetical protein